MHFPEAHARAEELCQTRETLWDEAGGAVWEQANPFALWWRRNTCNRCKMGSDIFPLSSHLPGYQGTCLDPPMIPPHIPVAGWD